MLDPAIISKRIVELRTSAGLTQKELADAIGISINSLKNYEGKRRVPDRTNLSLIADYFDVYDSWITGESEYKNSYEKLEINVGKDKIHFYEYALNNNLLVFDPQDDFDIDVNSLTSEQMKNLHDNIIILVKQHLSK